MTKHPKFVIPNAGNARLMQQRSVNPLLPVSGGGGGGGQPSTITVDGSALPDPVTDGTTISLQWDANFSPVEANHTAAGDEQLDSVLADLAAQAAQAASIASAVAQAPDIILTPAASFTVANAVFVETPAPPPPPPPVQYSGPFVTADGTPYWINPIDWTVGFDIDADPDPDIFVPIATLLPLIPPDVAAEISAKAQSLGWTP